ncbi:MAG: YdbL family protein [Chromatiales bacterium]|nr:YdbL family protein [Chromatiales bacterium]
MNMMRIPTLMGLLLLTSCVTINVYFPEAAAEAAADRIVREILGERLEGAKPAPDTTPKPSSSLPGSLGKMGAHWFGALFPTAHAADLNVDSPKIRTLQASMKDRTSQLEPFFASGALGLTKDGLVAVRAAGAVPLKDRNAVNQRVQAENTDRSALYKEIARVNGHPEWEGDIRSTFARSWVNNAPKGWYYQDASGGWKQK